MHPRSSLAGTVIWSAADRRRGQYMRLHTWLRWLVRYTLAFALFSYGFSKVIPLQFTSPPFLFRLMQPAGLYRPADLLWTFMGASRAYTFFSGAAEIAGGALLLFATTTTAGALLSAAVMLNVALLNFSYDLGVKLYSAHLLAMALFLLVPRAGALFDFVVRNRGARPADLDTFRWRRPWQRVAACAFLVLLAGNDVGQTATTCWRSYRRLEAQPPLYGPYRIEAGAPAGWQEIAFERRTNGAMFVRMADDTFQTFPAEYDTPKSSVRLFFDPADYMVRAFAELQSQASPDGSRREIASLTWSRPDEAHLILTGIVEGAPAAVRLRRIDQDLVLLKHRRLWFR